MNAAGQRRRRAFTSAIGLCALLVLCVRVAGAQADEALVSSVDHYMKPYVASNNFSGVLLVARDGKAIYQNAYGFANPAGQRNSLKTQFHLASLSMQFTAAAVMRLVGAGKLELDAPISQFVPDVANADKITVRNLLEETSGLPDVNALPEYSDILNQHQTAASLVEYLKDKPSRFEPGGPFQGEEHSAYNVLAIIVEMVAKQPFAAAVGQLVFSPLHMDRSGIDDDSPAFEDLASGYSPLGVRGLESAQRIHWSAKTGNGSAYATAADMLKWRNAFFEDKLLSAETRRLMLDYSHSRVGFGWFKNVSPRFGVPVFYMNGRAPGFTSFLVEIPTAGLTVIVLSNTYVSVAGTIGLDVAAMVLNKPFTSVHLRASALPAVETKDIANRYAFGADFYQPNAILTLKMNDLDASLVWPSGEVTFLIPVAKDEFIDRSYWEPALVHRSGDGRVDSLMYGHFAGRRVHGASSDPHNSPARDRESARGTNGRSDEDHPYGFHPDDDGCACGEQR
jgi:CubicO group peptidase (beta-lactamase class C family)